MATKTKIQTDTTILESITKLYEIVLYNDDYNTFEHVIDCLVVYCKHDTIQAEQCANIVHFNGKCMVKYGTKEVLLPIYQVLLEKGLSVKLEN